MNKNTKMTKYAPKYPKYALIQNMYTKYALITFNEASL